MTRLFDGITRWLGERPRRHLRQAQHTHGLAAPADPARAIGSPLIAQAFPPVRYPILPRVENLPARGPLCPGCVDEILRVRPPNLFAPRDFDGSPSFAVIKPTLAAGFDHRALAWHDDTREAAR